VPAHNRTNRASGLDLLVRARLASGDREGAKTALVELTAIASLVETIPLSAAASLAAGRVALAEGREEAAQRYCEDAVDGYLKSGAPFELSLARMELARVLSARGRAEDAVQEVNRAIEILSELKAELEIARARTLLATLGPADAPAARPTIASGLTTRELEVLRLVAAGSSNQKIAEQLFVSEHTVHRHVANILGKLNVSSRAAAVAQAARRGLLL
jgi:DNA-binding NarL/FixJ family response regulator